jgi:hypothetical protein
VDFTTGARTMKIPFLPLIAAAMLLAPQAYAQGSGAAPSQSFEQLLQASTTKAVIPIFSQLLLVPMPGGFKPVQENATAAQYILEAVPSGQTADSWTEMVTIEGFKGLATTPGITPATLFATIADGFQKSCPASFSSLNIIDGPIGGNDARAGVLSCGVSPFSGGKTSETALIAIIKGQADLYSVQWAERARPSTTPIKIAAADYAERLKALQSVKLCTKVPGEAAPYPSCLGGGTYTPVPSPH